MTDSDKRDVVVIAALAVTIAMAGAAAGRALSILPSGFGDASFTWYVRLRSFDVTSEVLALGGLAYVMPRTRLSGIAARVAAVLALTGAAAQVGAWSLEGGSHFLKSEGGALASGVDHVSELIALVGVVVLWFVAEYRIYPYESVGGDGGIVDEGA